MKTIVLEGLEGTGKTTLSRSLSLAGWGPQRYKVLRGADGRFEDIKELVTTLERLAIPVNGLAEDVYVADVFKQLRLSAILDRSLPSALAYGFHPVSDESRALLRWWYEALSEPIVLLLDAPRDVRASRVPTNRLDPWMRDEAILKLLKDHLNSAGIIPYIVVDASRSADQVREDVLELLANPPVGL